ncbi:MAG: hypothetical protein M3O34_02555, partial [Chloroflexota bacterium]|nr:hypothetical protein [Chloroflexota bacterium]
LDVPSVSVGSITIYLAARERPYRQRLLALNALPDPFVNDAALLTNVAPAYAPPGWHLLAAHVLGAEDLDDAVIERRARSDLQERARRVPRPKKHRWQDRESDLTSRLRSSGTSECRPLLLMDRAAPRAPILGRAPSLSNSGAIAT